MMNTGIAACALALLLSPGGPGALHAQESLTQADGDAVNLEDPYGAGQAGPIAQWTEFVPGSQPLIDSKYADLDWRERLVAEPLYAYDPQVFLDSCDWWEERKRPGTDFEVEEVATIIVRTPSGNVASDGQLFLGLPLRKHPDPEARAANFINYAKEVDQLVAEWAVSGADRSETSVNSGFLQYYGDLPLDKAVTLTEACNVLEELHREDMNEFDIVQIATGSRVPSWEWSKILVRLGHEYMASMQ